MSYVVLEALEVHKPTVKLSNHQPSAIAYDDNEFIYTVEKSLKKLQQLAESVRMSFILPSLPLTSPQVVERSAYLDEEIRKLAKVNIICLANIEYGGAVSFF